MAGAHGKGGGYKLTREPEGYRVMDILRLTENSLATVVCLEPGAIPCPRASHCRTLPMWTKLNAMITDFFTGMTVADLMASELEASLMVQDS